MIIPRLLTKGDKVVIVAPSGKVPQNSLDAAIKVLSSWGLEVVFAKHVYDANNYFAGSDMERLADLQLALDDSSVAAVLCARGGYGITRILQQINFDSFKNNPKWVIGFSDITAIHLSLSTHNISSIHGPMGTSFSIGSNLSSINSLHELLFNGKSKITSPEPGLKGGAAIGQITGGNLSLIIDSLATPNEIHTKDKILIIEEVGEKTYRIDRMFQQLLRAGKLDRLAGLAIGQFSKIDDENVSFGESWKEVITHATNAFSYPIGFGFSVGHEAENMPIIMGGTYQFKVGAGKSILEWQNPN